jgi:hypothetical protein
VRRRDDLQGSRFFCGSAEKRVPIRHSLRRIRPMVDVSLKERSPNRAELYTKTGRPSTPPGATVAGLFAAGFLTHL